MNPTTADSSEAVGQLVLIEAEPIRQRTKHAIAGFLAGYSGTTLEAYRLDLRGWIAWLDTAGLDPFVVERAHIELYARWCESEGSPSFAGFRFPPDVILLAVRWYLRYGLSYREVEELLAERGVDVDHVTIYRWVQRFTPLVIDVYVSIRRNVPAATRFFKTMLAGRERPREITTDLAAQLRRVVDELLPDVLHDTTQYANNPVECDHGRLKARLRPMRGLRTDRTASTVIRGHAFIQILRRGHYELGVEARHARLRVAAAFDQLTTAI